MTNIDVDITVCHSKDVDNKRVAKARFIATPRNTHSDSESHPSLSEAIDAVRIMLGTWLNPHEVASIVAEDGELHATYNPLHAPLEQWHSLVIDGISLHHRANVPPLVVNMVPIFVPDDHL